MKFRRTKFTHTQPLYPDCQTSEFVLDMPEGKQLQAIYINGKRELFGIIGSGAGIEFTGEKLILRNYSLSYLDPIIIEFGDRVYHYLVQDDPCLYDKNIRLKLVAMIEKATK